MQIVALHSAEASLVLELSERGAPLWRHFGTRLDPSGLPPLATTRGPASFSLDDDVPFSTAPPAGLGWFGPAAVELSCGGIALTPVFMLTEIAATATELTLQLADAPLGIRLEQRIRVDPGGAFLFDAALSNDGSEPITVEWLASALVPLPGSIRQLISWRGRHNAELVECIEPLPKQRWVRAGRRGIPGHGGPPAVIAADTAAWHSGVAIALQLAWSGDTRLAVERDDEGFWTLSAGAAPLPGEVLLAPGHRYAAPMALVAVSSNGRNGVSAQQHQAVRGRMAWPGGAMRPRPVHLNSWEACYFDHDSDRMTALVEAAAAIGVERFVLDDGWFRGRRNDRAGLGDWTADPAKYPAGLKPLADHVNALGMEFGLWVEPEMVNPDSDLYRAHPDWVLALPGRLRPTGRHQLLLDLWQPQVRDYLFTALDTLLRDLPIAYLKWDHNRDLAPAGGSAQVQGTYDLLARLRAAHPTVEIESCAGGGGRCDAGIAVFAHRFWVSDNIDAVSRATIQRGFLAFLPSEMMGAHVGASPAHATGRRQSLGFRAATAMPGHFGVELDPRALDDTDRVELIEWIGFYKKWRGVLHGGQVWIGDGADGLTWQAQGRIDELLLFVTRTTPAQDRRPQLLPLPFLRAARDCDVALLRIAGSTTMTVPPLFEAMRATPQRFTASWLAEAGMPLPPMPAESVAIFHIRAAA